MAKKLRTVLKELKKYDGNVYIGGENGSGFFYIGGIGDTEKMQKAYEKADAAISLHYASMLETLDHYLGLNCSEWGLDEKLAHIDDMNKLRSRILKAEAYVIHYKNDVLDCDVATTYDKTDPQEKGKIILLKHGVQIGKLWSIDDVK